jgi:vacuolar protein sorting-associated protein 13A/C
MLKNRLGLKYLEMYCLLFNFKAVVFDVKWKLKTGSFTLKNSRRPMIDMVFSSFSSRILKYPGSSIKASVSLKGMECTDGTTPGTLYPHLVRAKERDSESGDNFFSMMVEVEPLDGLADTRVQVRMLPLEVVFNPVAIRSVLAFFNTQAKNKVGFTDGQISALRVAAMGTFQGITVQTRMGLESAVEDHKTLDLLIDIDAPICVFPEKYTLFFNV